MKTIKSREYFEGGLTILNALESVNSQIINDKNNSAEDKLIRIVSKMKELEAIFNRRYSEAPSVRLAK